MNRKPQLTLAQILRWADAHHARTGKWPNVNSGRVRESPANTWCGINNALRAGTRGLHGGRTLARCLEEHRGVRNIRHLPPLSIRQILRWADAHRQRTGQWPHNDSGPIVGASGDTWMAVSLSLALGRRGLPGGSTLARTLALHRGKVNCQALPRLTHTQILAWADEYHERTGRWPRSTSGPVRGQPGTTWSALCRALVGGRRGLPRRVTLGRLLARHRGVQSRWWRTHDPARRSPAKGGPRSRRLTIREILTWADRHHERTGHWPTIRAGAIPGTPGETWHKIETALRDGARGLPRGSSLARLLAARRGARNPKHLPRLSIRQILAWADRHHRLYKRWPRFDSGPVKGVPGETWGRVNSALKSGSRGLPRGNTLALLLSRRRGVRSPKNVGPLTVRQILVWADQHRRLTGRWPHAQSGPVTTAPGETWNAINAALYIGFRGFRGGDSLHRLLVRHRK